MVLPFRLRTLLAPALAAGALIAIPSPAEAAKRQDACAAAHVAPAPGNLGTVRAAVLCLHNRERAAHGLAPLRANRKLRRAAKRHSVDMVTRRYFSHDSLGGGDFVDRVVGAGYRRFRSLGENIAWGTGSLATAAEIHRSWMESPGHRANILAGSFRQIGIGIAIGSPAGSGGATYTADFGAR